MSYISGTVCDDTGTPVGGRTVRAYRRDTGVLLGETTTASGTVAGDSSFANVGLLLHGGGVNGTAPILDSSSSPKSVAVYGNTQVSTAQSKFGGSSLYFDGTGDYLAADGSTSFAFGTGDFTLELWCYRIGNGLLQGVVDFRADNGAKPLIYIASDNTVRYYVNTVDKINGGTISAATWTHVAVTRSGTSTKMFLNGSQGGNTYSDPTDYVVDAGAPLIGTTFDAYAFNGYIDDLRITKGVARYTADFTAPSAAFPSAPITLSTGDYYIPTSYTGEVNVITLDDSGGTTYNDLILRTTPV